MVRKAAIGVVIIAVLCGCSNNMQPEPQVEEAAALPQQESSAMPEDLPNPTCLELTEKMKVGEYLFRVYYDPHEEERVLFVHRDGKLVHRKSEHIIGLHPCRSFECDPENQKWFVHGNDFTGDGEPNVVVGMANGGNCAGCEYQNIYSVGTDFRELDIGISSGGETEDLDSDGFPEILDFDHSFEDWPVHGAGVSKPIIFKYQGKQFLPALGMMKEPPLSNQELLEMAKDNGCTDLFDNVISLIYSGRAKQAWKYFALAYPKRTKCTFDRMEKQPTRQEAFEMIIRELEQSSMWLKHIHKLYPQGLNPPENP